MESDSSLVVQEQKNKHKEEKTMKTRRIKQVIIPAILLTLFGIISMATGQPVPVPTPRPAAMAPATPVMAPVPAPRPAPAMAPVMASAPATPKPTAAAPVAGQPKPAAPASKAAKQDPWWKVGLGHLIVILLTFVLAFASAMGPMLVKLIAKKAKITDQEQIASAEKLYDGAVGFAVNLARQQAHKLKDNPDAKAKRLDTALEAAGEKIAEYKLPAKSADWLKKKIEAKVGEQERNPG